jgi:hypothetical protein
MRVAVLEPVGVVRVMRQDVGVERDLPALILGFDPRRRLAFRPGVVAMAFTPCKLVPDFAE